MPLARFELRNEFALGKPELYNDVVDRDEDPKPVLDAVAVSGLVGILRQLGDLSQFAAEVFHGLQEHVVITASKSHKLMVRVQHLEAKLPPLEKAVLAQTSHIHFAYTAGCEWHTRIRNEQNHFISDDLPRFIMDSYEECRHPPNLHLLDKFDAGGPGSCLKRYSDPSYFKRVSGSFDELSSEILQQDRKSRKIKKKRSSRKNREISRATSLLNRSGRMQFTTPVNDHSYPQLTSELDNALKSDLGRCSNSIDSRSKSGLNGSVFRPSSSVQPEDQEYRESSSSWSMLQHDEVNSTSSCQETTMGDECFSHGTLPEASAPSSSSVTWEEKTEIVEPLQYKLDEVPDILCIDSEILTQEKVEANLPKVDKVDIVQDDVLTQEKVEANLPKVDKVDIVQDDVHTLNSSDIQCKNTELHIQMAANPQNVDQIDIPNDDAHTITKVSEKYQNDEVESDPDDFMDALNIIESESENECDSQSILNVSKSSCGVDDKVAEELTQKDVLHCPDNRPSSVEPNIGSHVLADTVTYQNIGHRPGDHPSNMESNDGSHILTDRSSPEYCYSDGDVRHKPEQQPSDSDSNSGSHILVDKDHDHVVDSPDYHASNMESNSGSHIRSDRDSPEHLYAEENVVHIPENALDDHASKMKSSDGSLIFADKDDHENLYADEQAVDSPEYQPSYMASNNGLYSDVQRDAYEHMEDNPKHYLSNTELGIRSHASAEKDAHSPEHCPDNVEPDGVSHSFSDTDFLLGVSNLVPSSYSLPYLGPSTSVFPDTTAASVDLSIPVPSSGDFPNTVPLPYGFSNSVSSSYVFPSSVASHSYSKEHMSQIAEKSLDLVKSSGLESRESSSIPDDTGGDPVVINPSYSDSVILDLPEPSGDMTASRICESRENMSDLKSCQPVTFWTNGGLLGLQPSKPPDFAVMGPSNQDSLDNSKEESCSTLRKNHMSKLDGHETIRNGQKFTSNELCSEDQTNGINFKEDSQSDRLVDSSSTLTKSGKFCHNNYPDAPMNGPQLTSVLTLGREAALEPSMYSLSTEANQEIYRKSSQSFGLGQRLLLNGFRRKFPPIHNDPSELLRIVQDSMPEQGSKQQNFTYHTTPDRPSREQFKCESIQRSPSSSPPVEHMKISFHPVNTSETSGLKLKIMDGSNCHEAGNTFSSFQLVPEHNAALQDIGSDSDDDTFCPSSPYILDEDNDSSHSSDSNSEQWESGENLQNKDQELYNALCRISSEESTSGSSELGGMVKNRNQVDGGITNHCSENDMEHAFSSPLLDLPDFNSMNYIVNCTAKDGSDAEGLQELQLPREIAPIPPPLPPAPTEYVSKGTYDNGQHSVSEALRTFDLITGGSSISSESKRNLLKKKANVGASLLGTKIKQEQMFNGQKEVNAANGKNTNEREDFLHQIRTKSFSLRPTVIAKATVTSAGSTNVSVTAILEKANAIRQAVGSDDGEGYDTWSDT